MRPAKTVRNFGSMPQIATVAIDMLAGLSLACVLILLTAAARLIVR